MASFGNHGCKDGPAPDRIAEAFARALMLAREHEGTTAPNPPVGCVLLDQAGNELAAAAHQRAGEPHAEALAIAQARKTGALARLHTVVATLEPCNHHGRTPPCSNAILETPAKAVWIACLDPDIHLAGGGGARLAAAGLTVRRLADLPNRNAPRLQDEIERQLAPFIKHRRSGRPFVTVKQALTRAGGMIPPPGAKTFTSPQSLLLAHRLRRRADAILTGSGTVLGDDPLFTVRLTPDHEHKRRTLVILDRRRRVAEPYLAAARLRGLHPLLADNLDDALTELGARGALEVLVEAGPAVTESVLASGLWDEHVLIEQAGEPNGDDRVTVRRSGQSGGACSQAESLSEGAECSLA